MWQKRVVPAAGWRRVRPEWDWWEAEATEEAEPASRRVLQQEGTARPSHHLSLPTSPCSCPQPPPWAHSALADKLQEALHCLVAAPPGEAIAGFFWR